MKTASFFALASALVPAVTAHYRWTSLIANGGTTAEYEYVRVNTNDNSPVTDVTSTDLRCNVGGLDSGPETSTDPVTAGSTVGLALDQAIYHPGVVNVYMAKAPSGTNISDWDGSGDVWFKVYQVTAVTDGGTSVSWPSVGMSQVTFTLPADIPDGEYFIRAEDIALHVAETYGGAQFYISCAQVSVTGGGNGTPGPLVAIPGVYTGYEPGILINIYDPIPANYTQPGPAVWSG
ncbi:lytic polysaccharide monooxygenase [Hydnomerulius pinastri MD-312]|uniref:lytic cellulose monooxygenase (C4-dehydrogenating) n=1 Tax=Hydnomerulius pinastri MD-312 TaxID=994086 RepID=A0A0C9VGH2_9AGAM|nr:lytic polysaccharide monooxygenase [Hydnomerulius pinastri MD-312]